MIYASKLRDVLHWERGQQWPEIGTHADHTKNSPLTHKSTPWEKSAPTGLGIWTVEPLWFAAFRRVRSHGLMLAEEAYLLAEAEVYCTLAPHWKVLWGAFFVAFLNLGCNLGFFKFLFLMIYYLFIYTYISQSQHSFSTASAVSAVFPKANGEVVAAPPGVLRGKRWPCASPQRKRGQTSGMKYIYICIYIYICRYVYIYIYIYVKTVYYIWN